MSTTDPAPSNVASSCAKKENPSSYIAYHNAYHEAATARILGGQRAAFLKDIAPLSRECSWPSGHAPGVVADLLVTTGGASAHESQADYGRLGGIPCDDLRESLHAVLRPRFIPSHLMEAVFNFFEATHGNHPDLSEQRNAHTTLCARLLPAGETEEFHGLLLWLDAHGFHVSVTEGLRALRMIQSARGLGIFPNALLTVALELNEGRATATRPENIPSLRALVHLLACALNVKPSGFDLMDAPKQSRGWPRF